MKPVLPGPLSLLDSRLLPMAVALLFPSLLAAQAPATTGAAASVTCNVTRGHSAGDDAIAAKRYKDAEAFYRDDLAKDPSSPTANLGLVRALIGQDNVTSATDVATKYLASNPNSALAEVVATEAAYRAGDFQSAYDHGRKAVSMDRCEGRALAIYGDLMDISGYHGAAAKLYATAHALRPEDELIRRDWIDSLPRAKRQAELDGYLEGKPNLDADDARGYHNELEHLQSHRPNECHLVSTPETATTKLMPIYGDNPRPMSYGLDLALNGKRRRLQIDTGAGGITLSKAAARSLGIAPEYHGMTSGVGEDKSGSYISHVASIKIGELEFVDCMVDVVEKSKLDVDGLIGLDVFRRWLVTLDYQNGNLKLAPLPTRPGEKASSEDDSADAEAAGPRDRYVAPEMKSFEPVLRIGHNILLRTGTSNDQRHFIIMDTGAQTSVLSLPFAKEHGKLHGSDVEFTGVTSKVKKSYITDEMQLYVANLVTPKASYYAFDTTNVSHDLGFEVVGLLGLTTLQRLTITIDYRDNLVKLGYDPKHDRMLF